MSSDEDYPSNATSDSYRGVRFADSLKKQAEDQENALAKLATVAGTKAKPRIAFVRSDHRYKEIKEELARKAKKRQTQEIIQE